MTPQERLNFRRTAHDLSMSVSQMPRGRHSRQGRKLLTGHPDWDALGAVSAKSPSSAELPLCVLRNQ